MSVCFPADFLPTMMITIIFLFPSFFICSLMQLYSISIMNFPFAQLVFMK